jgi:hypothetical protein
MGREGSLTDAEAALNHLQSILEQLGTALERFQCRSRPTARFPGPSS